MDNHRLAVLISTTQEKKLRIRSHFVDKFIKINLIYGVYFFGSGGDPGVVD